MFMSFILSRTSQPYTYVPALCKIRDLAVYTSIVETVNRHDLILFLGGKRGVKNVLLKLFTAHSILQCWLWSSLVWTTAMKTRVAEQAGREKILKGNVKHVLFYSEPIRYCGFNMFSYVFHDLNNQETNLLSQTQNALGFSWNQNAWSAKRWFKWQVQWKILKKIPNQTCLSKMNFSSSFALKNKLQLSCKGCILSFQQRERDTSLFPPRKK